MAMASRQWRDQVIQELHRQGLPSAYVDRLVDELSDHATDLFMEDRDMDVQHGDAISSIEARMGSPKQLASVAKAEFRRRTFAGHNVHRRANRRGDWHRCGDFSAAFCPWLVDWLDR